MSDSPSLAGWQPAADLLADRIILLTGAANGIGRALSDAMARHGATVIMLDKETKSIIATGPPQELRDHSENAWVRKFFRREAVDEEVNS